MKDILQIILFCLAFNVACAQADFTLDDPSAPEEQTLTLILAGGTVYGAGRDSGVVMDVGIVEDRIEALGDLSDRLTFLRIDVTGLVVVPGLFFIDDQPAADNPPGGIPPCPDAETCVRRGVTTVIGSFGSASSRMLNDRAGIPAAVNLGVFAGNGTVQGPGAAEWDPGVSDFSEAINLMARLPADRLELHRRGRIDRAAYADIVVLDPLAIAEMETFAHPDPFGTGVRHVFVNGQAVLLDGMMTGKRPGRILKTDSKR
jgi:N-acyl-D-aspartate/D-glutamate deacylase